MRGMMNMVRATSETFVGFSLSAFGVAIYVGLVNSPHSPPDLTQSIIILTLFFTGIAMIIDDLAFGSRGLAALLFSAS